MEELHQIERCRDLSQRDFFSRYDAPAVPVVLENATRDWKAPGNWTLDFFRERYGSLRLPIIDGGKITESTVSNFIDRVEAATEAMPGPCLYDMMIESMAPELLGDIVPPPGSGPALMESRLLPQLSAFRRGRPELVISGQGGNFVLHYDDLHVHAYVTQIVGDKLFWMYPPTQNEYMYPRPERPNVSMIERYDPVDLEQFPLFAKARPVQALLHAGDAIFIPAGWWHRTRTLSASIAVRHESATASNWKQFSEDFVSSTRQDRPVWTAAKLAYMRAIAGILQ